MVRARPARTTATSWWRWAVERRIQRTVVFAVHVDALAQVNMRIALCHHQSLLLSVVLEKAEVVFAVTCDSTIKESTHRHTTLLTSNQLQVNIQMRVWIEVLKKLVGFNYRFGCLGSLAFCFPVAECNGERFITTEVIIQYLTDDLGLVLLRTRWSC